jgi:uncharacterized YigZ family protein
MLVIDSKSENLFSKIEIKRSKFLSFIYTDNNFSQENIKKKLLDLKLKHPKAVHFVYAFRYFDISNKIVESFSDDGEPKNSSALPTINVLRGLNLINCGVITVRYYGGINLGIGGLVRAYSSSCNKILQLVKDKDLLKKYVKFIQYKILVSYTNLTKIKYQLTKYYIIIEKENFLTRNVEVCVKSTEENFLMFKKEHYLLLL